MDFGQPLTIRLALKDSYRIAGIALSVEFDRPLGNLIGQIAPLVHVDNLESVIRTRLKLFTPKAFDRGTSLYRPNARIDNRGLLVIAGNKLVQLARVERGTPLPIVRLHPGAWFFRTHGSSPALSYQLRWFYSCTTASATTPLLPTTQQPRPESLGLQYRQR
jgi:hypothetical protein